MMMALVTKIKEERYGSMKNQIFSKMIAKIEKLEK
jgi:hypothetical protein